MATTYGGYTGNNGEGPDMKPQPHVRAAALNVRRSVDERGTDDPAVGRTRQILDNTGKYLNGS